INSEQQFVYLAYAFLKGSLSFTQLPPTLADLSFFDGKYFWPLGPFPALLLIPFVIFYKTNFLQGFIQLPLTLLNFYLVYQISKKLNLSSTKSYLLAIFYIFGSVYTPVAAISTSWLFAQVTVTSLLLLAIYFFVSVNNKNFFLISILISLAILTRANLITTSVFFLIFIFQMPRFWKNLIAFTIPIATAILLIGIYNHLRFGNFLESGYNYQLISEEPAQRRSIGLFSVKHIPANLYYMLIKSPDPIIADQPHVLQFPYLKFDNYGMSIFFLSPILFLILKTNFKDKLVKISALTVAISLVPLLTYYGIGFNQVGYRYALDFFPFLLLAITPVVKTINEKHLKILIFVGVLITWFFTIEKLAGF
ncbi:hypothetical protein A3A49_02065, partial [Candidatus Curtissbacteria bacterium RIFCSPLOWO2_01_FULL_38_11b]